MKKILFFCYDGKNMPSSKVRCYNFSKALKQNGIETEVISCKEDLGAKYDGPDAHKMTAWQRIKVLTKAIKRLSKERKDTIFYVQKTGFHILAPLFLHFTKGNRIILDYDDYEYDERNKLSTIFFKMAVKNAECLIASSRQLEEFLKKFHTKIFYLPTGPDIDELSKNKHTNLKKKNRTNIHWGGLIGTEQILETLKKLANCINRIKYAATLKITGGGDKIKDLQEYCKQNNINNVEFLGWLDREKLLELLNNIDIGLMPLFQDNIYNRSKSPTKLFEYLAKGMITISSAVGEMNHIIQDGTNGFLAKDEKEFIEKLKFAIENQETLTEMKLNARRTAEKYSLQTLGKELFETVHTNFFD